MNFKKFLKSSKAKENSHFLSSFLIGQASAEYIILMVVLMGLLTVWLAELFPKLRENLKTNFFDKAVMRIISDSDGGGGGEQRQSGPVQRR